MEFLQSGYNVMQYGTRDEKEIEEIVLLYCAKGKLDLKHIDIYLIK